MKFQTANFKFHARPATAEAASVLEIGNQKSEIGNHRAFSLIEVLVVVSLLSLIVLALMAVFSSTQRAFRSAVTQTEVMEGSRATMDLMVTDLRGLTPSDGVSNGPVNLVVLANYTYYSPLVQTLPGSSASRTNLLNYFFVLGRNNTTWTGTGYIVNTASTSPLYPLYRFYAETNITCSPAVLSGLFFTEIQNAQWTNMSHLVDGVVGLTVRAYDPNGNWINNYYQPYTNALNTAFLYPPMSGIGNGYGEAQLYMFSNAVPASVELELGVLEDRPLAHAESLPLNSTAQLNYLAQQAGAVHLFRQRVTIPNVDPTAYQ
jgi:prepilin-type N-terminal cleavage/methylation domain-containing protein